jgi:hypothetical protein
MKRNETPRVSIARTHFSFEHLRVRIDSVLREYEGRYGVLQLPNIKKVFYGRDVEYSVERAELNSEIEGISATNVRALLGV